MNKLIKDNVIIIPFIYIFGTIMLIIRNKCLGFPFSPISLIQLSIIIVYLIISLACYSLINYLLVYILKELEKDDLFRNKIKSVIWNILLLIIIFILIITIFGYILEDAMILVLYFLVLPLFCIFIFKKSKLPLLNYIITITFYMTIVLHIPISLGGFMGQKVYFYNEFLNTKNEYTFYGVMDGMYELSDENNIYLIPIDKGYIEYSRKNNK